jgi:hypothetical protein
MPIGSGAVYVPAGIQAPSGHPGIESDADYIVLTPSAPLLSVYVSPAGWTGTNRCNVQGPLLFQAPVPADYLAAAPQRNTINASLAVLMPDGHTLKQAQPFARCDLDQPATVKSVFPDQDLYGDGTWGAHGGSWLSAIGGTLRVGELRPGGPPPRHALKIQLDAHLYYYNDGVKADSYRWPALDSDGYALDSTSALVYGGTNPALKPGSLLALPASVSIASLGLLTEPAQMLAWTLQNYGGYLVDDTAWDVHTFCTEVGPAGDFDAQFAADWGFPMASRSSEDPFAQDMEVVFSQLAVVDDNGPTSVGGGGTPLQPLAPPLSH